MRGYSPSGAGQEHQEGCTCANLWREVGAVAG
jgi:hypothetical protein